MNPSAKANAAWTDFGGFQQVVTGVALTRARMVRVFPINEGTKEEELSALGIVVEEIALKGGLLGDNGHLLQRITTEAHHLGLAVTSEFPKNTDQLGTQLAKLKPKLAQRGTIIERIENSRPRECIKADLPETNWEKTLCHRPYLRDMS